MTKIAHVADIHIKNFKQAEEYEIIFNDFFEQMKILKPDLITVVGDVAHSKNVISPEFVERTSSFFRRCAEIAPTVVTVGNHDMNLKNLSRQDSLTPIAESLALPNLKVWKYSCEEEVLPGIVLNHFSLADPENWRKSPANKNKINIVLYHGAIRGVETDLGWALQHGDIDISALSEFDYVMLGDIHKTNQIVDAEGRVRYPGSMIQQNFAETNDKGYLVWDIHSKDKFEVKHVPLYNPKPFVTISLDEKGRPKPLRAKPPCGSRMRIVSEHNHSVDIVRRAIDIVKTKYKPDTVQFISRAQYRGNEVESEETLSRQDLRDVAVQNALIEKYLEDYNVDGKTLSKVFELNRAYNSEVCEQEEISRNVKWELESLEWDNLFNYGPSNKIDFTKLNGIVGIFGKSYSGKSSIIDSLLFALFNTTSKEIRKNLDVINQNKERGFAKASISVENKIFEISRAAEKYDKKLNGTITKEARTTVDFLSKNKETGEITNENSDTRGSTDKNIRRIFGTAEDFFTTSMSAQFGSLIFINQKSTGRKEILAKFLDLDTFEKKFVKAHEASADLKATLRLLEDKNYEEEIQEYEQKLSDSKNLISLQKNSCVSLKESLRLLDTEMQDVSNSLSLIPKELIGIDIDSIEKERHKADLELSKAQKQKLEAEGSLNEQKNTLVQIEEVLGKFDIALYQDKFREVAALEKEISELESQIRKQEEKKKTLDKQISYIEQAPCNSEYSDCQLVASAKVAIENIGLLQENLNRILNARDETKKKHEGLEPEKVADYLKRYEKILNKKETIGAACVKQELIIERSNNSIMTLQIKIKAFEDKVDQYRQNKEMIDNKSELVARKSSLEKKIKTTQKDIESCEDILLEAYKDNGYCEQKLESLKADKNRLEDLRVEYAAYDLFKKCMHSNGIPFSVIKSKLPVINDAIAKILANVVEFEIFFDYDGNKLDIFIKHPKYEARSIETGSGAEKTLAATAIRLALLSISSLPKGDLFILDEPATELDEETKDGFIQILEMIKSHYRVVLLVSHLETLKDVVDTHITIENRQGYAYVDI